MLLRTLFAGACLVPVVGAFSLAQLAQQDDLAPAQAATIAEVLPALPVAPSAPDAFGGLTGQFPGQAISLYRVSPADHELQTAMEKYRESAADSDARDEAKEQIQKALGEQYDAYLEEQGKQLDAMEKKLAELRDQLKLRRGAKEKMVDLKFEMVLAQLEGLGWPESSGSWMGTSIQGRYLNTTRGSTNLYKATPDAPAQSPRSPRATGVETRSTSPRVRGSR